MKVSIMVVSAEGESAFLQNLARTLLSQMGSSPPPVEEHPPIEADLVEARDEDFEEVPELPRRHLIGNGMATKKKPISPASPRVLRSHDLAPRRDINWELARMRVATQELNECRLCMKPIRPGQAFRAPDSNPTARAHDDCVQARADATMKEDV